MDFGAVGDGVHDDTANIQSAIAAAQTAGGGVVWLPTGQYKTTATLNVTANGIGMRGVGI
jgi:polygalacturonase